MNEVRSIVIEQKFSVSREMLWNTITNPGKMRQWFFENIPDFKPEVGFKTRFTVKSESLDFIHLWTITEVIPLKKIKYNWRYEGYEGNSFVYFELTGHKEYTNLKITAEGIESFPQNIPEFKPESCRAGWEFFINKLKDYLDK